MGNLTIREAEKADLSGLRALYTHLHGSPYPEIGEGLEGIRSRIMGDKNHHILLGCIDGTPVSSCTVIVIENLTRQQRPYAVVENVITHPDYRERGYASSVLSEAKNIAVENNCYKIMLMTGSKKDSTLNFYRKAGYNSSDKTAFVQWL